MSSQSSDHEVAVFGGGCFWCTEAVFRMFKGVEKVEPGYAGGTDDAPTYEKVSSEMTGHAEVVRITFDPSLISYRDLLTVFFATHDPTTKDRQGNDVGSQYRSIILTTTEAQKAAAEDRIRLLIQDGVSMVTEVAHLSAFYPAESEHRDYYSKNKSAGYCTLVIEPKLEKVQKEFADLMARA